MRVVVVTTSYPAYEGDPCGHFVQTEALELAALGHEVHVLAPAPNGCTTTIDSPSIRLSWIAHGAAFGWPGASARLRARPWRAAGAAGFIMIARRQLQALRPDLVGTHWLVPSAYPIALAAHAAVPIDATAHGADVRALLAMPGALRSRIVDALLQRNVQVRFVAHSLLDALAAALPDRLRTGLLNCATVRATTVDLRGFGADPACVQRCRDGTLTAAVVGRLLALKRFDLAIRAVNLLGDRARLHVVGDGPERQHLRALDRVGNVTFWGKLDRNAALAWMAKSDVLLHPSSAEGAPTVVREARGMGIPVVACGGGEVARWAKDDPGLVIVEPTPKGIVRGIGEVAPMIAEQ